MINRALKIRIYPNKQQEVLINKTLGCCRFIYNQMLNERKTVYEQNKDVENKRIIYEWKYKSEVDYKRDFEWLKEVDSTALQQSRNNLITAYNNFFTSLKGVRKGDLVGYPKFKKKGNNDSYTSVMNILIDFDKSKIKIPKIKELKFKHHKSIKSWYRLPTTVLKSVTISKTPSGKYFAACLFAGDEDYTGIPKEIKTVKGLDCSLTNFYVDEQGRSPEYIKNYKQLESKLKQQQKSLSRKTIGSNNWKKQRIKVATIHETIKNKREDFNNKLSLKLIQENDCIVVEQLSLKEMVQSELKLGKSVMDLGYASFVNKLIYKAKWQDKTVLLANKWFASSKTCNICGYVNKDLRLQDREWICPSCGTRLLRDQNAAINLKNLVGLGQPDFKPVEKLTLVNSVKQEAKML